MSLGSCCVSGFKHEGTPSGKTQDINGVSTYISLPKGDYDKTKALLFLTDIFGTNLPNGQLLADSFADNGIAVYMPDYLNGDAISAADLGSGKVQLMEWLGKHGQDVTRPPLDKVINHLKEQGVQKFAAIGYCFGARTLPTSRCSTSRDVHFLWLNAGEDSMMHNQERQKETKQITSGNDKHKHVDFPGAGHGFAIRGSPDDPKQRADADKAFEESVNFIKAHL
ncbi:hypothetical protein JCM10049v2_007598 [Rhodotorula toruloides]